MLREIVIDHPHNEASALLAIANRALLAERGWEMGFWTVSDERPAHEAVAALGLKKNGEWEVAPLKATCIGDPSGRNTEDCETLARAGGWIYVFGSHFGPKEGPLEPTRHFAARFNESLVDGKRKKLRGEMEVVRKPFRLHRLINDALRDAEIEILQVGDAGREAFIEVAKKKAEKKGKSYSKKLGDHDSPLNIEGSTFLADGRLLLGLRYPVTVEGNPLLIEIDGIDRLFAGAEPEVVSIWILENIGGRKGPAGVRELDQRDGIVHVVTGNLDSKIGESELLAQVPNGDKAVNEHHSIAPLAGSDRIKRVKCKKIRTFDKSANVEGLAVLEDGTTWYAHDDEKIRLSST